MNRPADSGGFTLLETLIALALFAVLSTLAYGGLRQVLNTGEALEVQQDSFTTLLNAVVTLERDLENLAGRAVRDEFGDPEPALRAGLNGILLEFSRHVYPLHEHYRAGLQRVSFRLHEGVLYRDYWTALDRGPGTGKNSRALMDEVAQIEFEFHSGKSWQSYWPPSSGASRSLELPAAVRMRLTSLDGRVLERIFLSRGML